jgi:hypothetical protein
VDAQKYANGLETCENFIVRPQGPLCRRSGSKYLGPIKFPGNRAILIPFEYSDTQGYVLEFGRGYIHFWKNNGMVFETTNTEIESFNTASNGGLIQVIAPNTDLPLFGTTGYGTTVIRRKGSYPLISTSVPHTLRTGAKVAIQIGATKLLNKTVTRVTDYSFTIDQAWDASYDGTTPLVYTSGVLPGDRIYISGASDIPEINNKFAIVQSHNGWSGSEEEQFTLNIPFFTNDTNPSQEELWCIPIEISTDYGYEPRKAISSTVDVGGFTYVNIANHGFTDDDTIEIFQTNTGADGEWSITKITDNQFKLNGSTPVYNTATTGFARKKLNPLEDELKKIRVA